MALAERLFRLEQLDAEIEGRESALLELRRKAQRNSEVEAADAEAATLQAEEKRLSGEQRSLESDLQDLEARMKRDNDRMYGGKVVDPRELSSLEKELLHHRTRRDAVEERLLETMQLLEDVQSRLAETARYAARLRTDWKDELPHMKEAWARMTSELKALREEREALTAALDAQSLDLYVRLHASSGHAVSHVRNGVCEWCRVNVPPKDIQHARTALVTCTNCARVLYIGA